MAIHKQKYKIIANFIFMTHIAFILFFVASIVYSFINHDYILYHIGFVVGTVVVNLITSSCPLAVLEKKYRLKHNPNIEFKDSFYAQYFFKPLFGIDVTNRQVKVFLFFTKVLPGLLPLPVLSLSLFLYFIEDINSLTLLFLLVIFIDKPKN